MRASVHILSITLIGVLSVRSLAADAPPVAKVDFAKQIQPLLADKCFRCHGPDKHKNDLRLDVKTAALQGGASGRVIIPGKSGESLLIKHVKGLEDLKRMPPEPNDPLTAEQIELLRAWIDGGADWPDAVAGSAKDPRASHWSYLPPVRHDPPKVRQADWVRNPIDNFILARLEKEGLPLSAEADRETLIRRVSLDLIGLPPTLSEVDAFVADSSPDAYEKLVDRLLASPHYGENWGRDWLDAARYADTNGYEKDRPREMWRYRDWVINALNADMPFDQFTIEQMAGDMLPNATESQIIATAFHRNTMINEEGGVDTEEYRWRSVIDRVATTGTVFLGMTIQCCQCHNHKFDPITQREYYQFFSMLNNQDEPIRETPTADQLAAKARADAEIAKLEARYEEEFPLPADGLNWTVLDPTDVKSARGATLTKREDRSVLAGGESPDTDTYTLAAVTDVKNIVALRIEVLTDSTLPKMGPGRADNGNFVLSELSVQASPKTKPDAAVPVALRNASADFSQSGFSVVTALDGDPKTGWAVDAASKEPMGAHAAVFECREAVGFDGGTRLVFTLVQMNGGRHTIGRFRIAAATLPDASEPAAQRIKSLRQQHRHSGQAAWEAEMASVATDWRVLPPLKFASEKNATMARLDDDSILVSGDRPTRDVYAVEYDSDLSDITAFRLEVMADPRLPYHGPGRGSGIGDGDFMLNELIVTAAPLSGKTVGSAVRTISDDGPQSGPYVPPVKWKGASADHFGNYSNNEHRPEHAVDGDRDSGWTVSPGGIGKDHRAVFELAQPIGFKNGTRLSFTFVQNFIDQHTIGRFRVSATNKRGSVKATKLPAEMEAILAMPPEWRNMKQKEVIGKYYLSVAPELSAQHARINALRDSVPKFTTTLVMEERRQPRKTHLYARGEFLNPAEEVTPVVPSVLPPLPAGEPPNRLTLARWLVSDQNPLTARVIMNRMWQQYFGRGIVATTEDFGLRAEPPSHPELLDWLATEFVRRKWSLKAMHRLIVTSATYRQSSSVTPSSHERDPYNILLARGPRTRVPAEVIRDLALRAGGLLSEKIGGPSVYPPQPAGVSGLGHGDAGWPASTGEDRYRRGVYTFWKRSVPYPGLVTFDAPGRDTCVVKRVRSNTPLQALTLLNDLVFSEAAQSLARRVLQHGPPDPRERMIYAFRLCLTRRPQPAEVDRLLALLQQQLAHFQSGSVDPAVVALPDPKQSPSGGMDMKQLAAWTMVANVLLNLDETVTKG